MFPSSVRPARMVPLLAPVASGCAACRLRGFLAASQLARSRRGRLLRFGTSAKRLGKKTESGGGGAAIEESVGVEDERSDTVEVELDENEHDDGDGEEEGSTHLQRVHPLTKVHRSGTHPSTLEFPYAALIEPITAQLSTVNLVHLRETAQRVFGGPSLPFSVSTPILARTMEQRPLALNAFQSRMSPIEADAFLAAVLPGAYASITSALVETRRRLGSAWAARQVRRAAAGKLRILDAGGGGAGVLAVREMLRAEWERIHEEAEASSTEVAQADGRVGGMGVSAPVGQATVLAASDTLRRRASQLLTDTTFIPRLPDYVHAAEGERGKFDVVIAAYGLGREQGHERKTFVRNLWRLTRGDAEEGGVLILVEKGLTRGFEMVAGARKMLLERHIASPLDAVARGEGQLVWQDKDDAAMTEKTLRHDDVKAPTTTPALDKERGCIIAPCTTHAACPMFVPSGVLKGRRDLCHFKQAYTRPPFLQKLLHAKDKNFATIKFAYLAVLRGRDLRLERGVTQDAAAAARAFAGHDETSTAADTDAAAAAAHAEAEAPTLGMTLPRAVMPPIKRKGHVTLDLCTSAGVLERWTVPRSFSHQAYRDARKSRWGDLWALGAKTRLERRPRGVKPRPGNEKRQTRGQVMEEDDGEMGEEEMLADLEGGGEGEEGMR